MINQIEKATPSEVATEIIAQNTDIANFNPEQQVEFAQKAAKALMTVIDATKPLVMQGKRYLYFEHWQTVAKFFNTTVGIESTTKDNNGYIAKAVVYNKDGVVIGGAEASCMNDEKNWKGKPDFQLRSMAQTRAMAKALRSMYGFVAVLAGVEATPAEEMNGVTQVEIIKPTYKAPVSKPTEVSPANTAKPASVAQINTIKKTMQAKGYKEVDLIDLGFGTIDKLTMGTASELIKFLFSSKNKEVINA